MYNFNPGDFIYFHNVSPFHNQLAGNVQFIARMPGGYASVLPHTWKSSVKLYERCLD